MEVIGAASGDTRGEYAGVASLYLPIALAVVVVVFGAIAYTLVRWRARPGHAPRATGEHKALEAGIALGLAAVVAVLLATTFSAHANYPPSAQPPSMHVDATAFRWGWRFTYPDNGGVVSQSAEQHPAVLRVPEGARVRFRLTGRDVIHGFWIPELRFKRDAFPDRTQVFDLRFPRKATFLAGHCSVFCGLKHPDMGFTVAVLPKDRFDAWVADAAGSGG